MPDDPHLLKNRSYELYDRRYFEASPTWFAWNKLRVKDVYKLRTEPDFEGQNVFFHLNHPIRYVSITGLAIEIEYAGGNPAAKLCFITIDDGSERVLSIKLASRAKSKDVETAAPSNTSIDYINVESDRGSATLYVHQRRLRLGTVICARGSLELYRGKLQMVLKRLTLVRSTAQEMKHWQKATDWRRNVLIQPWLLSDAQRQALDNEIETAEKHIEQRRMKKRKWHEFRNEQSRKEANQDEEKRLTHEAIFDEGSLPGSEQIRF